jgi:hypothetical protein
MKPHMSLNSVRVNGIMMNNRIKELSDRITEYLFSGGLFNPELANHLAVRDLLMECREVLNEQSS